MTLITIFLALTFIMVIDGITSYVFMTRRGMLKSTFARKRVYIASGCYAAAYVVLTITYHFIK